MNALVVYSPYSGEPVGEAKRATLADVETAIATAEAGAPISRSLSRAERAGILNGCADIVASRSAAFAETIVSEAGKTIVQARKEVARCVNTLRLSAEEAKRLGGETIPFDSYPGSEDRFGFFERDPLGIVLAITPFNDPPNLVAHKLGPAIAGGNAVILKPSGLTPLSAIGLADALFEAGLPPQILSVLTGNREVSEALVRAPQIRMISFTGGTTTGEAITRNAGLKKIAMDLGGNAPVIVMDDCALDDAAERCVSGAFGAAGQNCIGVQRLLIQQSVYEDFKNRFLEKARALTVGDPMDESTDMGPMISTDAAKRIEGWVIDALEGGARLLLGHTRDGALYAPTILENVSESAAVRCEEVFAPVVLLQPFDTLDRAIAEANGPEQSLHAAIFTGNIDRAFDAARRLEAGGVMINDSSDFRFDGMPFGGYKRGSLGREGVRFAIEEMTQTKVICVRTTPS